MITLSNTGKTVTLFMDATTAASLQKIVGSEKVALYFNPARQALLVCSGHRKISVTQDDKFYLTDPSKNHNIRTFGKVTFDKFEAEGKHAVLALPGELPDAKPLSWNKAKKKSAKKMIIKNTAPVNISKPEVSTALVVPSKAVELKSVNVLIVVEGETLEFAVPTHELLKMTLKMAHSGYSVTNSDK